VKNMDHRMRICLITCFILLVGLGGALYIYIAAATGPDIPGLEMGSGIRPEDTKLYQHNLELYGGKANVIAVDFARWFNSLWHGKTLAFTTACIAVFSAFIYFFSASRFQKNARDDNNNV